MFNVNELSIVASALVVQQKSVNRLAAKEGQPETVAAEYRKVSVGIDEVLKKVNAEIVKATPSKVK